MTLTHLPTHASFYSNQTLGLVSAAEGFIYLSALLCGRVFGRKLTEEGFRSVFHRLGSRAARLYSYHLLLLAVAFTFVARVAVHTKQPSLQGLVDFYLAHPFRGVVASIILIYRPPLLDILPMYILFLLATPFILWAGAHWGWRPIVFGSILIWAGAQLGLRAAFYAGFIRVTHLDIPFSALGAFDLFAWQLLWAVGLWIGSGRPDILAMKPHPRLAVAGAGAIAVFFLIARYTSLWTTLNSQSFDILSSKWHLGALRLLNFTALAILFSAFQPAIAKWIGRGPLVLLGQASLEVFCAHLLICFAALALVGDGNGLPVLSQLAIIACSLLFLYAVAKMFSKERKNTARPRRED